MPVLVIISKNRGSISLKNPRAQAIKNQLSEKLNKSLKRTVNDINMPNNRGKWNNPILHGIKPNSFAEFRHFPLF